MKTWGVHGCSCGVLTSYAGEVGGMIHLTTHPVRHDPSLLFSPQEVFTNESLDANVPVSPRRCIFVWFVLFLIVPAQLQSLSQLCWHLITSLSVPQKRSQIYTRHYLHTASILKLLFWQSDRQGGNAITELAFAPWLRGAASMNMWGMCASDKFHVSSAHFWSRNSCRRKRERKKNGFTL